MRDYHATKIEAMEQPLLFHHFHDRGVSDLHSGRFRVHFALLRPDAAWLAAVVGWATDNCGVFELENIEPKWDGSDPIGSIAAKWQRALLFACESDATLTYLRFK